MVNGACIFYSERTSHDVPTIAGKRGIVNSKDLTLRCPPLVIPSPIGDSQMSASWFLSVTVCHHHSLSQPVSLLLL
jgi:hypothetical protein